MRKDSEKIKIFSSEDDKLKNIGELLSNDSSRKIMRALIDKEMYLNELAKKVDLRPNLIIHHLKKLEETGLLNIQEKQLVKKGNTHKHYKMIPNLFIAPNTDKEEIEEKGVLNRFFKDTVKFSVVGFATFFTWVFTKMNDTLPKTNNSFEYPIVYDETVIANTSSKQITENIVEPIFETTINYDPLIPIIVLASGLFLIYFTKKYK